DRPVLEVAVDPVLSLTLRDREDGAEGGELSEIVCAVARFKEEHPALLSRHRTDAPISSVPRSPGSLPTWWVGRTRVAAVGVFRGAIDPAPNSFQLFRYLIIVRKRWPFIWFAQKHRRLRRRRFG